ncbi:hypothetical protein BV25DRAFT_1807237 [Artomyces pyxidatus]|uniref:Uncharacterized protein n=1 Tax=Artomyces pyxidatus TaxID=48021 RepID=A0ACB8SWL1_9AGAM|nr:hypothetical protein BV25DRAFT_1807237 [Artomyces pyxidatus]
MSASPIRLPATFKSLYRLVLRASSASVLHHHAGTRYLRPLWRPVFREAAVVVCKLQNKAMNSLDRQRHEKWLESWDRNMDRTLTFLSTSARSRGLPHRLTRNLSFLNYGFRAWQSERLYKTTSPWDPNPQNSKAGMQLKASRRHNKSDVASEQFDLKSWGALEEVVTMAEGKSGISLGRIEFMKRRA